MISKYAETSIWNEIMESFLLFDQKMKLITRLRKDKIPKNPIQQTLDELIQK